MISVMIQQLWYLFVLAAMALAYRNKTPTRNHAVANVTIWNSQTSPLGIVRAMFSYRSHIPMYATFWALAAFIAWAACLGLSLLVSPHLIIGNAAPVKQSSIYYPKHPDKTISNAEDYRYWTLQAPQYLRAMDSLHARDPTDEAKSDIGRPSKDPVTLMHKYWSELGNNMYEGNYSYRVTGVEFGLQRFPELLLEVDGSCRTEYGWYRELSEEDRSDVYLIFCHGPPIHISGSEDRRPRAIPCLGSTNNGNWSFAFLTTALLSYSFSEGTDPWYLIPTPHTESNQVALHSRAWRRV
jgi:hypothetical protein